MDEVLDPVAIGGPRLGRKPPATPRSSISTINTAVGAALAQDFHQKNGRANGNGNNKKNQVSTRIERVCGPPFFGQPDEGFGCFHVIVSLRDVDRERLFVDDGSLNVFMEIGAIY